MTDGPGQGADRAVERIAPGGAHDLDAHQGWALQCHAAGLARTRDVDVLFLHGMAAGGWVWPEHWLAAFTGAGYRCWTMSLPGRPGGATRAGDPEILDRALAHLMATGDRDGAVAMILRALPGASLFDGPTLDDYADALAEALAGIDRPTVVVGHSLGGAVAQLLLRRRALGAGGRRVAAVAGVVLLCSVPPYGTWRAASEMAVTNPALWRSLAGFSLLGRDGADIEVMRAGLFPNGVSDRDFAAMLGNLRDESLAATVQALGGVPFAPPPWPRRDVLVIGGARDRLVPVADAVLTGLYYGGAARIVRGAGHMLMQEDVAGEAVAHIFDWLPAVSRSAARHAA